MNAAEFASVSRGTAVKNGREERILVQQMMIDRLGGPGSTLCANTRNAIGPSSRIRSAARQRFSMRHRLNELDEDLDDYGISRRGMFLVRKSDFGPTVLLDENLIAQTRAFMKRNQLKRLEINQSLGFNRRDVSCVGDFPFLTGLEIIHHTVDDISPIHRLEDLENLSIQTYCRTQIDFENFPRLRHCRLHWRTKGKSIFNCSALQSLYLDYFDSKDLDPLRSLVKLRKLSIRNSPLADVRPIGQLQELSELSLVNMSRISCLEVLRSLPHLRRLEVDGCRKLRNVDWLIHLPKLRILSLCDVGMIPSLKPLRKLANLEAFYASGDTNIADGDLSVLLDLPKLRQVALANRKHYTPSSHAIEEMISAGR